MVFFCAFCGDVFFLKSSAGCSSTATLGVSSSSGSGSSISTLAPGHDLGERPKIPPPPAYSWGSDANLSGAGFFSAVGGSPGGFRAGPGAAAWGPAGSRRPAVNPHVGRLVFAKPVVFRPYHRNLVSQHFFQWFQVENVIFAGQGNSPPVLPALAVRPIR